MADTPEDTRPDSWHRYFAIEANNAAWALAELPSRTPAQVLEMLNAAHTAALHWDAVGTELHHMRGPTLLAQATHYRLPTQAQPSLEPWLTVETCTNGLTSCTGSTLLAFERHRYDGLGRRTRQERRVATTAGTPVKS